MPSAKSGRVGERKRKRNAPLRSRAKTYVADTRRLIAGGDLQAAEEALKSAVVALDKAAQKGAIHRRNAARRKSRLMKGMNTAKGR